MESSAAQAGAASVLIDKYEKTAPATEEEKAEYNNALTTYAMSALSMVEMERQEWAAKQEGIIKGLKEEIEQLEKKRDAYKELVEYIRNYNYFQNLERKQEDFSNEMEKLNFEIEFSTNTDVIAEDLSKKVNLLNNQIASNMAGERAANSHAATYRDSIEKNYSDYVSFDANGNAIVDSDKMIGLQQQIADAKARGAEEQAELLELEKKGIEETVKAYDDARKKANTYAKNTQNNFKELEKLVDSATVIPSIISA
jgi:hypothetical protein